GSLCRFLLAPLLQGTLSSKPRCHRRRSFMASDSLPAHTPPQPPRLLDLVRQVARARFGQDGPGERYADWARRLILFHQKRHPRDLLLADVRSFREHVAPTAKAPLRCLDEAHTALTFLYQEVLGLDVEDSGGWRTRVGLGWLEPFSRGSNGAR